MNSCRIRLLGATLLTVVVLVGVIVVWPTRPAHQPATVAVTQPVFWIDPASGNQYFVSRVDAVGGSE